jgi:hypothetical protein
MLSRNTGLRGHTLTRIIHKFRGRGAEPVVRWLDRLHGAARPGARGGGGASRPGRGGLQAYSAARPTAAMRRTGPHQGKRYGLSPASRVWTSAKSGCPGQPVAR